MALPDIIWPTALPTWQLPGYTASPHDRYAMVRWASGAARRRALFTAAPVDVTANLYLSTAQAELLNTLFERGLVVGERSFAAPFMGLDGETTWYTARFSQPPQWTPRSGLRWDVQAALRLTGDGQAAAPTPSALTLRSTARLTTRADAQVTLPLVLFVSAQLDAAVG